MKLSEEKYILFKEYEKRIHEINQKLEELTQSKKAIEAELNSLKFRN